MTRPLGLLGADELMAALHDLPEDLQKRVLKAWVIRKAREIARSVKSAAPRGKTGNLKAGVVARASKANTLRRIQSLARAVVIGKKPAYHFHIINQGTPVGLNKSGNKRGKGIKANPFLDRTASPMLGNVRSEIKTDLAREVQRALDAAQKRMLRHVG
jgi:Bacteriophage HK97-gp10, putative tail-component